MKNISQRDQQLIWHPYTAMQLNPSAVGISHAKGSLLYTEDGKELIDCSCSWWTNLHGHAHPYICEKVSAQINKLDHVIFAGFTHEPAVSLAENLLEILGLEQAKVFYSDNGSTAVEVALKMAVQYWKNLGQNRQLIVALCDAYHGDTFGAMSSSARGAFNAAYKDLLFPVEFISKDQAGLDRLKELLSAQEPAAFIFEPLIQAASGMLIYERGIFEQMLDVAAQASIITIADEVFTGFGRTGQAFAMQHLGFAPDIMCFAKGLSGGVLPLGATTCKQHIYHAFLSTDRSKTLFHGHSFTANPVACAAGLASLELLTSSECAGQIEWLSTKQQELCRQLGGKSKVKQARSLGSIGAIELQVSGNSHDQGYFYRHRDFCYNYCLERGVLLRPLGNVLPIIPPYCLTAAEWSKVSDVIQTCVNEVPN